MLTARAMRTTLAAVVTAMAAPALTPAASAQALDARSALEDCSQALAAVESGSARWTIEGLGEGMFKELSGTGSGDLKWVRLEGTRAVRYTGTMTRTSKSEPETVDMVFTQEKVTQLDRDDDLFIERSPNDRRPHPRLATLRKLMLDFWVEETPFAFELERATSIQFLDETAEAGGETCDVIEIRLPELNPAEKQNFPRRSANLVRVFVAQSDGLPRRIESAAETQLGTVGDAVTLHDLRTGLMLTPGDILHELPPGWRVDSNLPMDMRTRAPGQPTPPAGEGAAPAQPEENRPAPRPRAANYEFTTETSKKVTWDSQRGRVTVLYFWGSWCLPCKEFSPLVSEMAANTAEAPIDVFGLAVRERNPATARNIVAQNDYAFDLVLEADTLASDFRVRLYPTIVVIDKEGRLVRSVHLQAGKTAEETMRDVREAVTIAAGE
ncbi:MAG: TlpA disulfide reductase family protein [Phycisphaerales bacterium JB040]